MDSLPHGTAGQLPPEVQALLALDFAFVISCATAEDMPITHASSQFYAMTGYSPNEVLGKNCRFLQGPATERRKVLEIRDAIREDRPCQVCLLNYRKDGTPFWNQFYLAPIFDTFGRVESYIGVQCDVTSTMEGRLAPPRPLPLPLADVPAPAAGTARATTAPAADSSGGADVDSTNRLQSPEPDSDDEMGQVVQLEQDEADAVKHCLGHHDSGSSLPSSLLQPLLKLQESFVLSDPRLPDCPIVHASECFLKFTGYPREEVVGRNCRFLQGPDTDRLEVARLRTALTSTPPQPITVTLLNYRKDGQPFWNALHISPLRDAQGQVMYFIGVQLDLSLLESSSKGGDASAIAAEGSVCSCAAATNGDQAAKQQLPPQPSHSSALPCSRPLRLCDRMAHKSVTGAARMAVRSLGGEGGLRRSLDCSGLPRRGYAQRRTCSIDSSSTSSMSRLNSQEVVIAASARQQQLLQQQQQRQAAAALAEEGNAEAIMHSAAAASASAAASFNRSTSVGRSG